MSRGRTRSGPHDELGTDVWQGGRLEVELRLFATTASLWLAAAGAAIAWGWVVGLHEGLTQALPWPNLVAPAIGGFVLVGIAMARELPRVRWPRRTPVERRRSVAWLFAPGALALPFAAWARWRDRGAWKGSLPSEVDAARAHAQLLELPRLLAIRFIGWGAATASAVAVILGAERGFAPGQIVALAILWIAMLPPFGAILYGRARSLLRPEYLSAPPARSPLPRTADLRIHLVAAAALACAGAIAAPLAAGYLRLGPEAPVATGLWVGGVTCLACCVLAMVLVASDLARDVARARVQVSAVAAGRTPPALAESSLASLEIRTLVRAVDRLVGRITEANVAKYVAIEKAKEADRLKSQFLANMSHDLRSPLNSILGFSELLISGIDGEVTEEQKEILQEIHDSGRHLLGQIDDILDTAKIEAGRLDMHAEPLPPATLVSRAIHNAKQKVSERIVYQTSIAAGLRPAFVDPYRTVQALENVLCFAAVRMDEGTIEVRVRRSSSKSSRRAIVIEVETPHKPATALQLNAARRGFFRIPGHAGLGLGLPIAGSILELCGGSLDIEDGGASMVFTVRVPAPTGRRPVALRLETGKYAPVPAADDSQTGAERPLRDPRRASDPAHDPRVDSQRLPELGRPDVRQWSDSQPLPHGHELTDSSDSHRKPRRETTPSDSTDSGDPGDSR